MTMEEPKEGEIACASAQKTHTESRDDDLTAGKFETETIELRERDAADPEAPPDDESPQCQGCCSCPNGGLAAGAIACTILAKILSDTAAGTCGFVQFEEANWVVPREVGIYRYYDDPDSSGYTRCVPFYEGQDEGDIYGPVWTAVHVLVGLGGLMGLACFIFACSATCTKYPLQHFRASVHLQLLLFLLYGLSFMVLGSNVCQENGCEVGTSGFVMLAAVPLWLVSSFLWMLHTYPPDRRTGRNRILRARTIWTILAFAALLIIVLVDLLVAFVPDEQQSSSDDWVDPGGNYEEIDCQNYFEGQGGVCGSSSYSCVMRVELASLDAQFSCADFCSRHGAACIETPAYFLTRGAECGGIDATQYFRCNTIVRRNVCTCSLAPPELTYRLWGDPITGQLTNPPLPPEPTPCEKVYVPDGVNSVRRVCEETVDSCSLYVPMTDEFQNCEMFCVQFGGTCLGAAADADDGCVVQEVRDCAEPAGDMICTCSL